MDIILFPACSFILSEKINLQKYLSSNNNKSTIITGALVSAEIGKKEIPIRLIVNNESLRIAVISLPVNKKVYALMTTPGLLKELSADDTARKFYYFKNITAKEDICDVTKIISKYSANLDYSKNIISIDEAFKKIKQLNIMKTSTIEKMKKFMTSQNNSENLINSNEAIIDNYIEKIFVFKNNKTIEEFDSSIVKWLQIGNINAMVAISSTITNIYKNFSKVEISDIYPPNNNCKVIAFDSGHHQYSGRYKRSLEKVEKTLNKEYKSGQVFLAFWKYLNSSTSEAWAKPNMQFNRKKINYNDNTDFIDVFEV
ncbi:MAG: hypothetical protein L3J08_08875 [Flavobacteriaceae bacterium]|nr:hypothetical protein [Flavobacteriaceae bacterium]